MLAPLFGLSKNVGKGGDEKVYIKDADDFIIIVIVGGFKTT
jgi:hypothetical protein